MESQDFRDIRSAVPTGFLIALLPAALPAAVWLDLTNLAEVALRRQASDLNSVVGSVRSYYASNVVGRVLAHPGATQVVHNYETIFSGQKDVTIHTERKKLTIFFSDIQNFTAATERLQPEQITQLLNEYFIEMSEIAHRHGGTIDKFIGDAMLIFFGDPGLDFYLDPSIVDAQDADHIRSILGDALAALDRRQPKPAP
jgi:hypothetical protein